MFEFERHKILMLHGIAAFTKYKNITVVPIYRKSQGPMRKLHKLWEHMKWAEQHFWYHDWKKDVADFDTIILMDGVRGRDVIEYIREKNPKARIIIYFINTITHGSRKDPERYKGLECEFAAFDRKNAEEWGICFKHYCYEHALQADDFMKEAGDIPVIYDAFFIGVDKNRLDTVLQLKNEFAKLNLQEKFMVVRTKHKYYSLGKRKYVMDQGISYEQIMRYILQSRAILDIVADDQNGLTLRPMEAMFFRKKLITNNTDIVNYNFYNPDNIFLLGQRPLTELPAFLDSPVQEVPDTILDEYRMENWLEDFFVRGRCI